PKPNPRNPVPEARSPIPDSRNPIPETRNPKPETQNLHPQIQRPFLGVVATLWGVVQLQTLTLNNHPGRHCAGVAALTPPHVAGCDACLGRRVPLHLRLRSGPLMATLTSNHQPRTRNPEP
ncbi:hypothetical protein T484DRAFT_1646622, partial [Baffinella frigidus]